MYLKNEDSEAMSTMEDFPMETTSRRRRKTIDVQKEHVNWSNKRQRRKCKDFSDMSYWQVVSHCSIL